MASGARIEGFLHKSDGVEGVYRRSGTFGETFINVIAVCFVCLCRWRLDVRLKR